MRKHILLMSSALIAATAVGTAAAQDDDTIVVTATKREQTLQEVPVAVSVVAGETVERAQIVDILDLQSVVPSLRVSQLQQSGNTTFIIRGFGNGANNTGIEPSVGVFIDGVYRSRSASSISDLPGLQRVEVLRGPQSTLFGKNASAGVISFVTLEPSFDWTSSVEATVGNYNQYILKGYVSGPAGDNTAFSLSGSVNKRDGYVDNVITGEKMNERDRFALRGQMLYNASDDLTVRIIADYDELDEACCYAPYIEAGALSQSFLALGAPTLADDPFSYEAALDFDPTNELINYGGSIHLDWDLPIGTVTSISSARKQETRSNGDVDFSPAFVLSSNLLDNNIQTLTQEIRLAGSTERLDYLLGGFYFHEEVSSIGDIVNGPLLRSYAEILAGGGNPAAGAATIGALEQGFGFAPGTFYANGLGSFEDFQQDNDSYSLFAQGDFAVTDKLTATLGVAYTYDQKEVTANVVGTDPFYALDLTSAQSQAVIGQIVFGGAFQSATGLAPTTANITAFAQSDPTTFAAIQAGAAAATPGATASFQGLQFIPPFQNFPNAVEDGKTEDDKVTYTARLAYDLMSNVNVYVSYATGFKASSFNLTRDADPLPADFAALQSMGLLNSNVGVGTRFAGPEETTVIELGIKTEFDMGSVNITVFDQTIEGFQSAIFSGTGFNFANAGEQTAKGVEVDVIFRPVDPLTLTFAGTFLDPKYESFVGAQGPNGPVDLSGATPAGIHETSLYFGAEYEFEVGPGVDGFIRGDYQYEDEVALVDNIPESVATREVNQFNASIGLDWENGFSALVWGRNLTDDEYYQSAFPTTVQPGSVSGYPNQPKTYGITLRKQF